MESASAYGKLTMRCHVPHEFYDGTPQSEFSEGPNHSQSDPASTCIRHTKQRWPSAGAINQSGIATNDRHPQSHAKLGGKADTCRQSSIHQLGRRVGDWKTRVARAAEERRRRTAHAEQVPDFARAIRASINRVALRSQLRARTYAFQRGIQNSRPERVRADLLLARTLRLNERTVRQRIPKTTWAMRIKRVPAASMASTL